MKSGVKKYAISGFSVLILLTSIFFIGAVSHPASQFKIKIDGTDRTLEYAIANNILIGKTYYQEPTSITDPGHSVSKIWVSTDSGEMTLLNALATGITIKKTSFTSYTSSLPNGHLATEVTVSALGKNLQQVINDGNFFVCVPATCASLGYTCGTASDGCGGTLDCGTCGQKLVCSAWDAYWSCVPADGNLHKWRTCTLTTCAVSSCVSNVYTDDWVYYCEYGCVFTQSLTGDSCNPYLCGDGRCTTGELCSNCPQDCGACPYCGDGSCNGAETCSSCSRDCGACPKVICTELYNQGIMDEDTYKMDVEYASIHFSEEALKGYHAWAIPVVKAMRQSKEDKELVIPMVEDFLEEVAYRMGKSEIGNEAGKIFLDKGIPLFERIGVLIDDPGWGSLFDSSWLEKEVVPVYTNIAYLIFGDSIFFSENIFEIFFGDSSENKYNELVENYFTEEKVRELAYDAKEKGSESDVAFANALIENLEKAVEEIELLASQLE